jgi:hypothetical protein
LYFGDALTNAHSDAEGIGSFLASSVNLTGTLLSKRLEYFLFTVGPLFDIAKTSSDSPCGVGR